MDSISNIQPFMPAKASDTVASRVTDSFGDEINSLLTAMVSEALPSPSHLGANVDVRV